MACQVGGQTGGTMKRIAIVIAVVSILTSAGAFAGDIKLPADSDDYSALVAKAAAHDAGVNFRALRLAFLDSKAGARAANASETFDKLRSDLYAAVRKHDDAAVRAAAEQMLSIDYTDLEAHKMLRQACSLLKDEACAELHYFIEFGLLNSIIHPGDGKSCATGWDAVQVKEEYIVLAMMGVQVTQQSLISAGNHQCDAMQGTDANGARATYYFIIDAMMTAEAKALTGK